ncbi:mucin-2-like, partial [Saccostrea cucullata]|uniref:mucin-2-like n=1 Tax=Saccostrea cuccullata TaxID=36930 RepID=UPI002ED511FB
QCFTRHKSPKHFFRFFIVKLPTYAAVYYPEDDVTGIIPTTRILGDPLFEINSVVTINWSKDLQPPALIISLSDCRQQLEDAIDRYEEALDEDVDDTTYTPPQKKERKDNKLPQKENVKDKTDSVKGKHTTEVQKEVHPINGENDSREGLMVCPQGTEDKIDTFLTSEKTTPESTTLEDSSLTTSTPSVMTPKSTTTEDFFQTSTTSPVDTDPKSVTPGNSSLTTPPPEIRDTETFEPDGTFVMLTTPERSPPTLLKEVDFSYTVTTTPERTRDSTSSTSSTRQKQTVRRTSNPSQEWPLAVSTPDPKHLSTTLPVLNLSEYFPDLEDSFVAKQHGMMQTVEENRQALRRIEDILAEIKCQLIRSITSTSKTQATTVTEKVESKPEQTFKNNSSQTTSSTPAPSIFANIELLATSDDPPAPNKPTADLATATRRVAKSIFESVEALAASSEGDGTSQPHKIGSPYHQQSDIAKQWMPLNMVDFLEFRPTEN